MEGFLFLQTMSIKSVSVFCGSSPGYESIYAEKAYELGRFLANNSIDLVFGGSQLGLMGKVADGVMDHKGKTIGVLPGFLDTKEIAHHNLSEFISVESMHERKMKMHELSDAVITIPGGFGTMDELFEMLTWAQLGLHQKPIGLWNINSYFDNLLNFISKMNTSGFLNDANKRLLISESNLDALLSAFNDYEAPELPKWIKSGSQT